MFIVAVRASADARSIAGSTGGSARVQLHTERQMAAKKGRKAAKKGGAKKGGAKKSARKGGAKKGGAKKAAKKRR